MMSTTLSLVLSFLMAEVNTGVPNSGRRAAFTNNPDTWVYRASLHHLVISTFSMFKELHDSIYRVTIQLVTNLSLTSTEKFCFGLARPGQAKMELLF